MARHDGTAPGSGTAPEDGAAPKDGMARAEGTAPGSGTAPERTPPPAGTDFAAWVGPSLLAMSRLARRLAPAHDPDDVVQDALERAWRKQDQFDPARGSAQSWLLAITADRARALRRKRVRRQRLAPGADQASDATQRTPGAGGNSSAAHIPDPQRDLAADLDLDRAISALPARQRLAVALHYFLDLPVAEAAQVMGCSAGTVKSTLFDARTSLRRALGDDNDGH